MQTQANSQRHTRSWAFVLLAGITAITVTAGSCPLSKEGSSACCVAKVKSCDNSPKCSKVECSSERGARDCSGASTSSTECKTDAATVTKTVKQYKALPTETSCNDCGTAETAQTTSSPSCQDTHYVTNPACTS